MEEEYEFLPPPPPPPPGPTGNAKNVGISMKGSDVKITWTEREEVEGGQKVTSQGSTEEKQLTGKEEDLGVGECAGCGNEVKADQGRLKAGNRLYHNECFTCYACQNPISGKYFDMESRIYCEKDYQSIFVYDCARCNKKIYTNSISNDDDVYHVECFKCDRCDKALVENGMSLPFVAKDSKLYCADCAPTGKTCFHCDKEIFGPTAIQTTPTPEIGQVAYHRDCFNCGDCGGPIIKPGSSKVAFMWKDNKPFHPENEC